MLDSIKNCKYSKHTIAAAHPRMTRESTIHPTDRLQIVYNKFVVTLDPRPGVPIFNVIFLHGTGMDKAIWNYYIDKLIQDSQLPENNFQFHTFLLSDAVSHCDSALANEGKLGVENIWIDGAKDTLKIIEHESSLDLRFEKASNIVIGHSLGGHQALMAGFLSPLTFDALIAIEPVVKTRKSPSQKSIEKLFKSLDFIIKTEFDSDEQYVKYMRKYSFYKDSHPRILNDLINEERLVKSPNKVCAKSPKEHQLVTYGCFLKSAAYSQPNFANIPVPTLLIDGADATWNPPNQSKEMVEEMPNCEAVAIPKGTHCVHLEQPDDTIAEIKKFLLKRSTVKKDDSPITLDRAKIFERNFKSALTKAIPKL